MHLFEAQLFDSPLSAAFHCYHSVADGASICTDGKIDGKGPYEYLRDGGEYSHLYLSTSSSHQLTFLLLHTYTACTHSHYGYCDLSGGPIGQETVADCFKAGLDDALLPSALQMLPSTIEFLFLNENEGLHELKSGIFENMPNPSGLKALYFDDSNITTIDEDAFWPLENLQVLSLNFNKVAVLQDDLLKLPKLIHFSINGNPTPPDNPNFGPAGGYKPGQLTSDGFTAKVFQHTPNLERFTALGNAGITKLHDGMFEGLSKLDTLFLLFTGLDNDSFSDDVFEPLVSMKFFDLGANFFTDLDPNWFGEWSSNIERLVFWKNQLGPITDPNIFAGMPKLKQAYFEDNPNLLTIPRSYFSNNPDLEMLTLGPSTTPER